MQFRSLIVSLLGLAVAIPAAASTWHPLDPAATLVIDTTKGRILVEMRPELAPRAVERVILLAREQVYDGLLFHRCQSAGNLGSDALLMESDIDEPDNAGLQKIDFAPAVHLALDQFELSDLPLGLSVRPG
jgi:hypothetical protein